MFVKPAEGRTVRRPDTLVHLRSEGEVVPDGDEFWTRRLRDGDVERAEPTDAPEAQAAEVETDKAGPTLADAPVQQPVIELASDREKPE